MNTLIFSGSSIPEGEGFVRLSTILQVFPVGKSTWWDGVRKGKFPPAYKLNPGGVTAWRAADIRDLLRRAAQPLSPKIIRRPNKSASVAA